MAIQSIPLDQMATDTSRFDCVDGLLVERPLLNDIHSDTQLAVTMLLRRQTKRLGLDLVARQEWTLDEDNQPRHNWMTPDVLVSAPDRIAKNRHALPPAFLAVEILSEGQTAGEMFVKAQRYFAWGMKYAWVIDPEAKEGIYISAESPNDFVWVRMGFKALVADPLSLSLEEIFSFEN